MPILDNPRHEKFCQAVASGMKGAGAYRAAYGKDVISARQRSCELLKDRDISERIAELLGQSASEAIWTGAQIREYLTKALTTPLSEVDATSTLCQAEKRTEGMHEIKMIPKLGAAELLAKLNGDLVTTPAAQVNLDLKVTILSEERRKEVMELRKLALTGQN
jgi:hypothetical protein